MESNSSHTATAGSRDMLSRVELPLLIVVPVTLAICAYIQINQSALITAIAVVLCLVLAFLGYDRSAPALRQIMPVVVIASLAIAGRIVLAAFPYLKPVSALCILAGAVYGRRSGFMVGALAALGSNFFFGQGLWTPWQMYSWGLVGYIAGVLAEKGLFKHLWVVLVYGFVSGLLYGFIMNSWFIVGYVHPITWQTALGAYAAGLVGDVTHGIATVGFLAVVYVPWRKKLERIKLKYSQH